MLTAVLTALKAVKDAVLTALKAIQDAEKKTTLTKTKYKDLFSSDCPSGYDDLCFSGSSIPSLCVCWFNSIGQCPIKKRPGMTDYVCLSLSCTLETMSATLLRHHILLFCNCTPLICHDPSLKKLIVIGGFCHVRR
jgi:hypothetical protein